MLARVALGVLVVGGVLVAIVGGWGGLFVYLFLAAIAGGVAWGATAGGEWLETASRGRFHDRRR